MSGGSGGQQNSVSEYKPPGITTSWQDLGGDAGAGPWGAYLNSMYQLANRPYTPSGIPSTAPWNDYQNMAGQMTYDRAVNGAPDLNAARGAMTYIDQGGTQNQFLNPDSMAERLANGQFVNPTTQGLLTTASGADAYNPYIDPKYSEAMIGANADAMTRAAQIGPMAQTDAAAAMGGAYGGSAYQEQQALNNGALDAQIGQMAAGVRSSQYDKAAQLWQQGTGNRLAAAGQASQNYNSNWGNILNATSMLGGFQNQDVQNQINAAMQTGNLSQDDWKSVQALMGSGNDFANNYQRQLDALNAEWARQQGYDSTVWNQFGNALTQAGGGQGTATTSLSQGGVYPALAGLLGIGGLGMSMFGGGH